MNVRSRKQKLIAEINITPFTDVILVLLVIFMITTPLILQSGVKVSLPEANHAKPFKENPSQVAVTVTNEGVLYLDSNVVTRKELRDKIKARFEQNQDLIVVLVSDKMVRFKDIVSVFDMLSGLGIKNLTIMARNAQ